MVFLDYTQPYRRGFCPHADGIPQVSPTGTLAPVSREKCGGPRKKEVFHELPCNQFSMVSVYAVFLALGYHIAITIQIFLLPPE